MIGNALLLVQSRWAAIGFQVFFLLGSFWLLLPINLGLYFAILTIQILVNLGTYFDLKRRTHFPDIYFFCQLLFDLVALTAFILTTGGLANPFSGLFLLQAIFAIILIPRNRVWLIIFGTSISYVALLLFSNTENECHERWMQFHLYGMIANHVITTTIIGIFAIKIIQNLRSREHQLAARQSLASSGAFAAQIVHNIGTPLNIIAIVAEDMTTKTVLVDRARILQEITRCRASLGRFFDRLHRVYRRDDVGVIDSAIQTFSDQIRQRYTQLNFTWTHRFQGKIQTDSLDLLLLLFDIVIENAVEANATNVEIITEFSHNQLFVSIYNNGQPFSRDISDMMQLGYSEKESPPHVGMGLFLVRLIVEGLGGQVRLETHSTTLKFEFPLSNLNLSK